MRDAMPLVAHVGPSLMLDAAVPLALALVATQLRRRQDRCALLVAAAAVAVALLPPVGEWAEDSVAGHMVQHLVLIIVAAPAIALPLAAAPSRLRRRPTLRSLAAAASTTTGVVVLGVLHALAVIAVHVPAFYDGALSSWAVHGTGHVLLLVTGGTWLAAVVHRAERADPVAPVVSLLVVATTGAVLGAFLMFAPSPLYAHGTVADQQLAGALMGVAGATYAAAGVVLTARMIGRLAAPRRTRVPPESRAASRPASRAAGRIALSVATTAGLAVAGLAVQREPSSAAPPVPVDRGEELYRRDCAWCHGVSGEGTARGIDISERGTSSVFYALSTGRMPIADPDAAVRRGDSPYSDDEILAIVAYTSGFVTGPEVPDIAGLDGDVSVGGTRYRLLCAACHGATGEGGAQAAGSGAPSVLHANRSETAAAIIAGPGQMPSFGSSLAVEDVAAVAAYVEEIQDPATTGIALPGVRVGEGLVAWLVLAVACLGFVAWTGRRV
jgi:ubiquinol-cytochrome c reductase cytochrome c subunit